MISLCPRVDASASDLARNVYCVFGLPIDALDMTEVIRQIDAAVACRNRFFLSTPNLDFLVRSRIDPEFRETLLVSDLCVADGMPIVWLAWLIGVPLRQRVSGSDIFEALKTPARCRQQLKVFLFGGAEGVAAAAAETINGVASGLICVGTINPGFGAVDAMSGDDIIDTVNSSGADLLAVSLGAEKGQAWLHRNRKHLTIPVRAHLGATINFLAGGVKRAPRGLQRLGLEWLWRIKEEPYLWRRYAHDGLVLFQLLLSRALPLAIINRWHGLISKRKPEELLIITERYHDSVTIKVFGDANRRTIGKAIACFQETLTKWHATVVIDLGGARVIDERFLGLLLMVRKYLKGQGANLRFIGVSSAMRRLFWLNEVDCLLNNGIDR